MKQQALESLINFLESMLTADVITVEEHYRILTSAARSTDIPEAAPSARADHVVLVSLCDQPLDPLPTLVISGVFGPFTKPDATNWSAIAKLTWQLKGESGVEFTVVRLSNPKLGELPGLGVEDMRQLFGE